MSTNNFIIEIGIEELPHSFILPAINSFKNY